MPAKPLKPCNFIGCHALTRNRYCDAHSKVEVQRVDKQRGTAAQRGYGRDWQRYRVAFLAQHPLCVACEQDGWYSLATVVDHIKPHKGDKILFWDPNNHQSLCKQCHDAKTAREDGGFGNTPHPEKV